MVAIDSPFIHFATLLIPNSCPVVVLGGSNANWTSPTTDIKIYDSSNNVWENTQSLLTSGRAMAAVAAVNDNAIFVIGWCTNGKILSQPVWIE